MDRDQFLACWQNACRVDSLPEPKDNLLQLQSTSEVAREQQTNDAFSDKWSSYNESQDKEKWYQMQREWYLQLYGFENENALADFLGSKKFIFDAGCGLGYKAAWFARLAPESLVVGMDFSDAVQLAAESYADLNNLFFAQGDISRTDFLDGSIDYVNCDQVIMHTQNPNQTFAELARITRPVGGQIACYFYSQKALPRELLDEHFRQRCATMSPEELWEMSEQLTVLGRRLADLNLSFEAPDIPALGIKGGTYDVQRFIYWNFIKCFWNEDLGKETSVVTNYDWYSPSNARRYSEEEIMALLEENALDSYCFHREEACYSGRFAKRG
jgi:SAM-dependent methyltransferase